MTATAASARPSPTAFRRALAERLRRAQGYQRFLYAGGALLIAAGAAHVAVFLADAQPWAGPLGWRKPIEFGVSLGLTGVFMGVVMSWLPPRRWLGWPVALGYGAAAIIEGALISMQAWRGVPSHFNETTAFDAAVFDWMGRAVLVIALAIAVLTLWALVSMRRPPSMALAGVAGLALLLAGQFLGLMIVSNGSSVVEGGNLESYSHASTYGAAGNMKLPHALALHAIEVLPALAWLLSFSAWPERRRAWTVAAAASGYALLVAAVTLQMLAGRSLRDLALANALLAALGALALAVPYALALRGLIRGARGERIASRSA